MIVVPFRLGSCYSAEGVCGRSERASLGLATRVGGLGWYAMRVARLLRSTEGVYRRIELHRVAGWHKVAGSRSGAESQTRNASRRQAGWAAAAWH